MGCPQHLLQTARASPGSPQEMPRADTPGTAGLPHARSPGTAGLPHAGRTLAFVIPWSSAAPVLSKYWIRVLQKTVYTYYSVTSLSAVTETRIPASANSLCSGTERPGFGREHEQCRGKAREGGRGSDLSGSRTPRAGPGPAAPPARSSPERAEARCLTP